jgi:hypothetical protein
MAASKPAAAVSSPANATLTAWCAHTGASAAAKADCSNWRRVACGDMRRYATSNKLISGSTRSMPSPGACGTA